MKIDEGGAGVFTSDGWDFRDRDRAASFRVGFMPRVIPPNTRSGSPTLPGLRPTRKNGLDSF